MSQQTKLKNVLFIMPHPDDEVAIVGRIKKYLEEQKNIHCVWITDGNLSADKEIRQQESIKVMNLLKVPRENLHFLNFPDGKCIYNLNNIVDLLTKIMEEIKAEEVYTTAYEGGHPDHDSINFCVNNVAKKLNIIAYEFPMYNKYKVPFGRFGKLVPANTKTLFTDSKWQGLRLKLKTVAIHKSQWGSLFPFILFNVDKKEPYRLIPDWDYTLPPHSGKLFYEKFLFKLLGLKFINFKEQVEKYLRY